MAAVAKPGVVLLHSIADKTGPNFSILTDAKRRLTETIDGNGHQVEVSDLPFADEVGQMNFYLGDGTVILSISGRKAEYRKVIGVPGRILAKGGGGARWNTPQIPA